MKEIMNKESTKELTKETTKETMKERTEETSFFWIASAREINKNKLILIYCKTII